MLSYIIRHFEYRFKEAVLCLYNYLVRQQLECAVQFWCPSLWKVITRLERVQARATKLIPYIRHMRYEYWIAELDLFSLGNRWFRGQLIEVFKILWGFHSVDYRDIFQLSEGRTRYHGYQLELRCYHHCVQSCSETAFAVREMCCWRMSWTAHRSNSLSLN